MNESASAAWESLRNAAVQRAPGMFDAFGALSYEDVGGTRRWYVRLTQDRGFQFTAVDSDLDLLVVSLEQQLADAVADFDLRGEVLRQAALQVTGAQPERSWSETATHIAVQTTNAVVAVPVSAVFSDMADTEGCAMPIRVGSIVAGHLDERLEQAVAALARDHGLVGFRFSSESWWTEDFITAKEDDDIAREILERYQDSEERPMFVVACHVQAAGTAASLHALLRTEALLGALVLLDHHPGQFWTTGVPSIPHDVFEGPAGAGPQIVDGRALRSDRADNEFGSDPFTPQIDAGAHLLGPARHFLVDATVDPELAAAMRLAYRAVANWSPEAKNTLAAASLRMLMRGMDDDAYENALRTGSTWRSRLESSWPEPAWPWRITGSEQRAPQMPFAEAQTATSSQPQSIRLRPQDMLAEQMLDAVQTLAFARASEPTIQPGSAAGLHG